MSGLEEQNDSILLVDCVDCGKDFKNKPSLMGHIRIIHKPVKETLLSPTILPKDDDDNDKDDNPLDKILSSEDKEALVGKVENTELMDVVSEIEKAEKANNSNTEKGDAIVDNSVKGYIPSITPGVWYMCGIIHKQRIVGET